MSIYSYEEAFGDWDKTTTAMRNAVQEWFSLYYGKNVSGEDPCQKIAYAVVTKLVKSMFGEYGVVAKEPVVQAIADRLNVHKKEAVQLALVGGECFIKPWVGEQGVDFTLVPRNHVLVFNRDAAGNPVDIGTVERTTRGKYYYTLLERRKVDEKGYLTIENRLYRSLNSQTLGGQVNLYDLPEYASLAERYRYKKPLGSVGMVRIKTPMLNCVDGSADGVAVYAAAADLIHNIDRNEALLNGEFERGQSRIIASSDLLGKDGLQDNLFVGLDDDPEQVGITVFSPALREQSFLARKQEYLRNIESIVGLRRGTLSDTNIERRTATEIASSAGDYNLTVIEFQAMWEKALRETVALCCKLARLYGFDAPEDLTLSVDWGNGILYDEDKTWLEYKEMVDSGMLKPEVALGWRFGMPANTQEQLAAIRKQYMPQQ
jgi:A118 family predicted phage portal protein